MAERTTVNVGEPADERPVDSNCKPCGQVFQGGDQEPTNGSDDNVKLSAEDFNDRFDKLFPDLDSVNRPEFQFDHNSFYDEQSEDRRSSADGEWNDKSSKDSSVQISRNDILYKILPLIGAASYEYFSLKVMNPSWFLRTFYGIDQRVSDVLWIQSHFGIGLYIYSRRHLQALTLSRRVLYSTFGSFLFNYGSCLFWALGKSYLPRMASARVGFGLLTGGILLFVGHDYLLSIDKMCSDQID